MQDFQKWSGPRLTVYRASYRVLIETGAIMIRASFKTAFGIYECRRIRALSQLAFAEVIQFEVLKPLCSVENKMVLIVTG